MKYASTAVINGVETVVTVLSLATVPGFDPANPSQENTYGVDDAVQVGWIKQGAGFVAPPVVVPVISPPVVPRVTAVQGLLALDQAGLAGVYEAWANDPARTFSQRTFINREPVWRRDDPTLISAATSFGLTESQIDDLFTLAKTL